MADLIDRAAVLERFKAENYERSIIAIVREAPAVDAVEVVHCAACVHWDCYKYINPEYGMCKEHVILKRKDGFCDSGERKKNV